VGRGLVSVRQGYRCVTVEQASVDSTRAERATSTVHGLRCVEQRRSGRWVTSTTSVLRSARRVAVGWPTAASRGRETGNCGRWSSTSSVNRAARKSGVATGAVVREAGCCGYTLQRRSRARKADEACLHTPSAEWSEDPKVGPA